VRTWADAGAERGEPGRGAATVAVAFFALTRPDAGPAAPQNTATVTRGTLEETVEITGSVASSSVHELTFATAGTVEVIDAAVGERVRRNQLIAKLDTDALEDQLAAARTSRTAAQTSLTAAESSLKAAESNLASAKSQREALDEEQPTAPPGVPGPLPTTELQHDAAIDAADAAVASAEAAVENARAAIDNGRAAIDNAQASITATETALAGAEIRAPVAGRVTRLLLELGDRVTPGILSPAGFPVQIMDLGDLRIDAQASEDDVVHLAVNQDAAITFDALDDITLDGHICEIESVGVLVQGVPSYPVKVCLDTTDERVRVGLTATVDVASGTLANVLLLPSRAITLINDKHTVTLLLADNRPVETQVEIGASSDGMTEIVNGLTEGQRVLLPDGG
jgi:multidrug efflux pump subunit AcrA (membrane-fusion protein)